MKRGLSSIVATVLIVLLVILLVGVIWVNLFPMLNEGSEFDFSGDVQIISSEGYTVYDSDLKYAGVQVGVSADAVDLDRIRLTFLFDGESRSNVFPAPEAGQTKTYLINLSGEEYEQPASVSISPIDIFGKEGEITSTAELKTGDLADASGELLSLTGDFVEGDVSSGDSGGDLGEETVPKKRFALKLVWIVVLKMRVFVWLLDVNLDGLEWEMIIIVLLIGLNKDFLQGLLGGFVQISGVMKIDVGMLLGASISTLTLMGF